MVPNRFRTPAQLIAADYALWKVNREWSRLRLENEWYGKTYGLQSLCLPISSMITPGKVKDWIKKNLLGE